MATLNRYRVIWTGGPGGQGVSTFFSETTASTALADIRAFFNGIAGIFPNSQSWTFPGTGDQIESTTGALVGGWSQAAPSAVTGGLANANYAAGVGLRVVWQTNAIVGGRRLRGATFLTSISSDRFDQQGTLGSASLTTVQTAADALVAANSLAVWSRPRGGVSGYGTIEGAQVPDRVTSLRSRRY